MGKKHTYIVTFPDGTTATRTTERTYTHVYAGCWNGKWSAYNWCGSLALAQRKGSMDRIFPVQLLDKTSKAKPAAAAKNNARTEYENWYRLARKNAGKFDQKMQAKVDKNKIARRAMTSYYARKRGVLAWHTYMHEKAFIQDRDLRNSNPEYREFRLQAWKAKHGSPAI